jgi:hypothetical protein
VTRVKSGHCPDNHTPPPVLLADLTRVKSARACLPVAGAFAPAQSGTAGFPSPCASGEPLANALARSGNGPADLPLEGPLIGPGVHVGRFGAYPRIKRV